MGGGGGVGGEGGGQYGQGKTKESLHWKLTLAEKPLAAPGTQTHLISVLHLAYQLDTLPTELSLPKVVVFMTGVGFGKSAWGVVRPNGWGSGAAYTPVRCIAPWEVHGGEAPQPK